MANIREYSLFLYATLIPTESWMGKISSRH